MCSFTQESLLCANCGQLLSTSSILFRTCDPKPKVHCRSYKKRAILRRYVPADECNGCARRMFEEEMDMLAAMEEERQMEMQMAGVAEESPSNSEHEADEEEDEYPAGAGWREAKLEHFIKPTKRGRRGRA